MKLKNIVMDNKGKEHQTLPQVANIRLCRRLQRRKISTIKHKKIKYNYDST